MYGSMNDYRPLSAPFTLAMPYRPRRNDWRDALITALRRCASGLQRSCRRDVKRHFVTPRVTPTGVAPSKPCALVRRSSNR